MKKLIFIIFLFSFAKCFSQDHTILEVPGMSAVSKYNPIQKGMIFKLPDSSYGGGIFSVVDTAGLKVDNGLIFPLQGLNNLFLKRAIDQTQANKVDWFIPTYSDTADLTTYIQNAVNSSNKKTLSFTANRSYTFSGIILPITIILQGNGCFVTFYDKSFSNATPFFFLEPGRLKFTDSTASANFINGSASSRREMKDIKISGFNADCRFANAGLVQTSLSTWTGVSDLEVFNNNIINSSGNAFRISGGPAVITDSSGYAINVNIHNNTVKNGGHFVECTADSSYALGSITIRLRTSDKGNILNRIAINRYIRFTTNEYKTVGHGGYLEGSTYNASNAVYQVTSVTPTNDSTRCIITIASGSYNPVTGWTASGTNTGLKAPIINNAWILPLFNYEFHMVTTLPLVNTTSGSNKFVRTLHSTSEDAYGKNLYAGEKFWLPFGSAPGYFTITQVIADTVYTNYPATVTGTSSRMLIYGSLGVGVAADGNFQNLVVKDNVFEGGSIGTNFTGSRGKGMYPKDLPTSATITGNVIKYMWMMNQWFSASSLNGSPALGNVTINRGDSIVAISSPSSFTYYSKDIDGDGIADNILTSSTTTSANATALNSWCEGDLVYIEDVQGLYKIVSIPSNFSSTGTIKLARFDPEQQIQYTTGFINSKSIANLARVYNNQLGSAETIGKIDYDNNKSYYSIRGGSGDHISGGAYLGNITNNEFYNAENADFELSFQNLIFKNNTISNVLFTGNDIPGISSYSSMPARSAGTFMSTNSNNVSIVNNKINFVYPDSSLYLSQIGGINLYPRLPLPSSQGDFIIYNNEYSGISGRWVSSTSFVGVNGFNYPLLSWNKFTVRSNKFRLTSSAPETYLFASETDISNNTWDFSRNQTVNFFAKDYPNPDQFYDSSTYTVNFNQNTFNKDIVIGSDTLLKKANLIYNTYLLPFGEIRMYKDSVSWKDNTGKYHRLDNVTGSGSYQLPFNNNPKYYVGGDTLLHPLPVWLMKLVQVSSQILFFSW